MAEPRSEKYVWVSWLARLMVGEITCYWAPWFKTRYKPKKAPSDFDQVSWKMDHTQMLHKLLEKLEEEGKEVFFQGENWFQLPAGNLILAGKPDIIALSEQEAGVYDCKTGQPKESDRVQVMIYMYCLSQLGRDYLKGKLKDKQIKGYLIYKEQTIEIPAEKIDQKFEENLRYFLNFLDNSEEPKKRPSPQECRFCDIAQSDCPERIEETEEEKGELLGDF